MISTFTRAPRQGWFAGLALLFGGAIAGGGETIEHRGAAFWIYRLDLEKESLRLFLPRERGKPLTFRKLEARLNRDGKTLKLAANSGIYEPGFLPTGLHVSEGRTVVRLNLKDYVKKSPNDLTPNVYLKPNGVFFVRENGRTAGVLESHEFARSGERPVLATQSGPLLVRRGIIHPAFNEPSKSRLIRNGIGVAKDGTVILACSDRREGKNGLINLYGFAELFRDRLNCPSALYLDGDISEMYIRDVTGPLPDTNWFAGVLAIVEEKEKP